MKSILLTPLLLFAFLLANGQNKAINYKELQKYLPTNIMGYAPDGDLDGNSFEMNEMSYSTAVRDYKKGDSQLTISIMDYHGAENMFSAATMAWGMGMSYEDDSQKAGGIEIDNFTGWQVYQKDQRSSELILAYKERYIITIVVSDVGEDFAKSVLRASNLDNLP